MSTQIGERLPAALAAEETAKEPPPRRQRATPGQIAALVLSVGVVIAFLYPFWWLVSASLKPREDVFDNEFWPNPLQIANYAEVWSQLEITTWLYNSLVVGVAAALTVTLSSALVAFGFSYFDFPGKKVLFWFVLATMMLPGVVTLIPTYLIWDQLGLATTQVPLWAGNLFGSAFYIFLLRQFFKGLPRDTLDAARVDGCGYFSLFWRIVVPMSKPALAITFIFEFQASWVDLLRPLVYLQDPTLFTLPRGLKAVLDQFGQGGQREWELVLAANVIATIPMIVLFIIGGRYVVQGITISGGDKE